MNRPRVSHHSGHHHYRSSSSSSNNTVDALPQKLLVRNRGIIFVAGLLLGVIMTLSFAAVHWSCSEDPFVSDTHRKRLHLSKQEFLRPRIKTNNHQATLKKQQQLSALELANHTLLAAHKASTDDDSHNNIIIDFEHQPGVVIATKIHGPDQIKQLVQCLCLLTVAYNHRPLYDVVVFHTMPLSEKDITELTNVVHPAKLILAQDSPTLLQQLQNLTPSQTTALLQRCNATSIHNLAWWTRCSEPNTRGVSPLSYTWQAEFRSLHLWHNPYLQPYRTMMWIDSDAFCTKLWDVDPVAVVRRHDLTILFDNFPQGSVAGEDLRAKIMQAYDNDTLCELQLNDHGYFQAKGGGCIKPRIHNIHGFFHITDLDFYRSAETTNWFRIMMGDSKFSRRWDDQLAITIPAAMRAANTSWHMQTCPYNISLQIYHNSFYDGSVRWRGGGGFQKWWQMYSQERFPEGRAVCNDKIRNGG